MNKVESEYECEYEPVKGESWIMRHKKDNTYSFYVPIDFNLHSCFESKWSDEYRQIVVTDKSEKFVCIRRDRIITAILLGTNWKYHNTTEFLRE